MSDNSSYEKMRNTGATAADVFQAAMNNGKTHIEGIKLVRELFDLSLVQAKEVYIVSCGIAASLDEYQEKPVDVIEQAINDLNEEANLSQS